MRKRQKWQALKRVWKITFLIWMVAHCVPVRAASGLDGFQTVSLNGAQAALTVSNQTFYLSNSGANSRGTALAVRPFVGSGQIIARVERPTGSHAKAGLVFRENTNAATRFAGIFLSGEDKVVFERVLNPNEPPIQTIRTNTNVRWLRLTREGDALNGFYSPDGTNWTQLAADTVEMPARVSAGLLATEQSETAFRNARMLSAVFSAPAPGKIIMLPADIFLKTDVANFRSKIERVEFFYGVEKLGERKTSPYEMTWSNTVSRSDFIRAKVTDDQGNVFFTAPADCQIKLPSAKVKFIGEDTTTRGNWKGHYGSEGFIIPLYKTNLPPFAEWSSYRFNNRVWSESSIDERALLKIDSEERFAGVWNSLWQAEMEVSIPDGKAHQVAFYFLDWDRWGRVAQIDIVDSLTGKVLNSEIVSAYTNGKYLMWSIVGNVKVRIIPAKGQVFISGLFFDPERGRGGNGSQ